MSSVFPDFMTFAMTILVRLYMLYALLPAGVECSLYYNGISGFQIGSKTLGLGRSQ